MLSVNMYSPFVSALHLQGRSDGAAHPVLRPVCHAGGDGCVHRSEEGTRINYILYHSRTHLMYLQSFL